MSGRAQAAPDNSGLSWSQLRAFEACARLRSFASASAALGLTSSAVRYQLSLLEGRMGVRLFERSGGRLEPTKSGSAFAERIARPMRELEAACAQAIEIAEEEPLTLTAPPLFARHFLFDPEFLKWCEDRRIRLDVSDTKRDLFARRPIAAIRMGVAREAGLATVDILSVSLVIAAAPAIAASASPHDPSWWARQTLIKMEISDAAWPLALSALSLPTITPRQTHRFSAYAAGLEAATLGRGIILAPLPFAKSELAAGRLERISDVEIPSKLVFSLVMEEELAQFSRGRALRRKLTSVIASDARQPGRSTPVAS